MKSSNPLLASIVLLASALFSLQAEAQPIPSAAHARTAGAATNSPAAGPLAIVGAVPPTPEVLGPPTGACCVDTDCFITCTDDVCDALGGTWYGGEDCDAFICPGPYADHYVTAPHTSGLLTTCGAGDDCSPVFQAYDTEELVFFVDIPHEGIWSFNTCLFSGLDTWIYLGTDTCLDDIAYNDDQCSLQSEIVVYLPPGGYYAGIEGFDSCGEFIFDVHEVLPGDLDADGDVDVDDFWIVLAAYGSCAGDAAYDDACDYDADACITLIDFGLWMQHYRDAND